MALQRKKAVVASSSLVADILGGCMIIGSACYKIPQIVAILNARRARGVVLSANAQDVLAYMCGCAYSYGENHPFAEYGENVFQGGSTLVICLQIMRFEHKASYARLAAVAILTSFATAVLCQAKAVFGKVRGTALLRMAKILATVLSLTSKVPTIVVNERAKKTGELSMTSTSLNALGSLVRMVTLALRAKGGLLNADILMTGPQAISLIGNFTIMWQILYYGANGRGGGVTVKDA